jgi:superfamily II DNA or RNA helicase/HKD family nuclease
VTRRLVEGLYEEVVTGRLLEALEELARLSPNHAVDRTSLNPADAHVTLARHLRNELERALASVRGESAEERIAGQVELANRVLEVVRSPGELVALPEMLRAIYRGVPPPRPAAPMASTTLFTRNRAEPALGHELVHEMASADRVDALISFVTMGGVRVLRESLMRLASRAGGGRLRVLTTTYMGVTEPEAVAWLARLPGAEVKVSYDGRRSRLHAKAWLFHRESGLSTAYVGSANLSSAALTSGHEWMVKLAAADLPHVVEKLEGAFESLWKDAEFEPYDPEDPTCAERLRRARGAAVAGESETATTWFTLRAFPFQEEILERLRAEREVHGRRRNLVVAATGTGKTVVAALDYAAQVPPSGIRPRLLFLAHRRELLVQARDTFRQVLQDGAFGSLLTGGDEAAGYDHLFATIEIVRSRGLIDTMGAEHWQHVVVDECHHVPAESYQEVVPRLRPSILVGLTATPERSDARSLLPDFDGHIAAELRLWHALERQLLAPFEYYGLSDNTDLRAVRWNRRSGYDVAGLEQLYTGDDARVDLVVRALHDRVARVDRMRALGFCVSVAHAELMAQRFTARGIPSVAVHGGSDDAVRAAARQRLERREVGVIFTCDLYNEGVDLPFIDTLLFLRPTSSAILFTQQLGRGLRLHRDKTTCLVLDFIGQHREEFRFDGLLSALTGVPRGRLRDEVDQDFPYLPSGCTVRLDQEVRELVLRSLRRAVAATQKRMAAELAELAARDGARATLAGYLEETGRELDDVYGKDRSFSLLRKAAGLQIADMTEEDARTTTRLGRLLHVDDPERLRWIRDKVIAPAPLADDTDRKCALMLGYQLVHEPQRRFAAEEVAPWLRAQPASVAELSELVDVLQDRVPLASDVRPVGDWPLVLHRHYERREILAACGYWTATRKVPQQQGVLRFPDENRELLFVTLDKSDGGFSPTTRYRDYAISRDEFHWETQNAVAADSETARRYIEHVARRWDVFLFVQPRKGEPFAFLGPVSYLRHGGDRPVAIIWRLAYSMPASLFQEYATLAGG